MMKPVVLLFQCCIQIHVSGGGHLVETPKPERIGDEDKKRILDELKSE